MRRPFPVLSWLLALGAAACSDGRSGNEIDLAAAASRGQSDIANYAATAPAAPAARVTTTPPDVPAPRRPAEAATPLPDDAPPDAVVRRYVAAIGAHRYDAARALWDEDGAASGLSPAAFAAAFARYVSFDAVVGTPYDEDAGAGQRFVTVPVTATGTLASGGRFRLQGPVILHRAADGIESDDPHAHAWRIRNSEMKPRPAAEPSTTP